MSKQPVISFEDQKKHLSAEYWRRWNNDEQARIDADIEKYRKADATVALGAAAGTPVSVTQLTHDFKFGAHIFNFNQLGAHEWNEKYKALYGELFNSATIAFYWRPFEPKEGQCRFEETETDTEEWWNACKNPKWQRFWRRPATDPVVDFCEKKHLRLHGHPLVWGNRTWQYPDWLMAKLPHVILAEMLTDDRSGVSILEQPLEDALKRLPADLPEILERAIETRVRVIAERYGARFSSWDVCNESNVDFQQGRLVPGSRICRAVYNSFMPGDYCHHAFQTAMKYLPVTSKLNINEYHLGKSYAEQAQDMMARGDRIDCMGFQMHRFNPQQTLDIAAGAYDQSPEHVRSVWQESYVPNMKTHLSEITITSPGGDEKGEAIQAVVARNLYRLWFSLEPMMGITWWNVVDDCGAPREPAISGLFHRDMTPKLSYFALNDLINREWRTNLSLQADAKGAVAFRGFKGTYRAEWRDNAGNTQSKTFDVL